MLFSSLTFIYIFLPITLLLCEVSFGKLRSLALFVMSFLFYFWGEPKYSILMLVSILNGYLGGILIEKSNYRKPVASIFIAFQFLLLGIFKYTDFFIDTVNSLTGSDFKLLKIALPIGISFYSFQIISYLIDVYRKDEVAEKNFIDFGAYVTMFPQLIAGPIVRYTSIREEMKNYHITIENFSSGITRFMIGLAKKVILADNIVGLATKLEQVNDGSFIVYWVIGIVYTLQIYLDFSGYSDMAIGLGKMMGFTFHENFNYPLESKSITEFWRRWHISLSTWLKDYIYIPLGGSRCSTKRWIINILLVWSFSGLWHGASWNFVIWGVYFGFWLILEKLVLKQFVKKDCWINNLVTIILVVISFIIFTYSDLTVLGNTLKGLVNFKHLSVNSAALYEITSYSFLLILCILGSTSLPKKIYEKIELETKGYIKVLTPLFNIVLLVLITSFLIQSSVHPFLYFRF